MRVKLSPNIISGGVMPSFFVISSMGPALRIGNLRVMILKLPLVVEVSACPGATVSAGAPLSEDILFKVVVGESIRQQGEINYET
jgi:hypothetical protein